MSYKTNPILNRIKINKGWKNPYLPTKTLNYSRDISLWFKVYLLLKIFLNLKKIQLVSFEIRFDQQNKKILYLRINKKGDRRKKRKKKKLALNQILKKIQTPMLKKKNAGSIFFLYKNLTHFKKQTFWNQNVIQKKNLSNFWLTKPKVSSWLNTLEKIQLVRQKTKKNLQYAKKDYNFSLTNHWKSKFYTNKQKQLLAQREKIKKKNLILSLRFFALLQQKKTKVLQRFIQNLEKEIRKNKMQIQKISQMYSFLFSSMQNFSSKTKNKGQRKKKFFLDRMQRQKLKIIWKFFKKQFSSLNRVRFFRKELPSTLLNAHKKSVKNRRPSFLKSQVVLKKMLHLNFLIGQISANSFLIRNYFLFTHFNFQSKLERNTLKPKFHSQLTLTNWQKNFFLRKNLKKYKKRSLRRKKLALKLYYNISLWITLRKVKKRKRIKVKNKKLRLFRRKSKKFQKKLSKKFKFKFLKQYTQFLAKKKFVRKVHQKKITKHIKKITWGLTKQRIAKYYKYRLPYRKMHFDFRKFETNFQLKYLIQDFVQKYFSVQVETKIVHVLNAQKNTNFFRLVFAVRKKKHNLLIRKKRLDTWNQKQIFLASRLKFVTSAKKRKIKFKTKKSLKGKKKVKKQNKALIPLNSALIKNDALKVLAKKELFLLSEKKRLKWRMSNYFSRIKQGKDFRSIFKYLMPTLIDFSQSFDPQLLANVLAKVVKQSKKQTLMLNTIKALLQAIQLPKNVGYKIVLSGRINSKKKSRLIYITQKQITLQVFNNNMNYAYAQANARIGAFGVKIWVYSKRI